MHTGSGATNNLCNGMSERSDLGLKLCASRRLAFKEANENGQLTVLHDCIVFSIPVTRVQPQTNPGLTGGRTKDAADCVSERLREIAPQGAIRVSDELYRNDCHAA